MVEFAISEQPGAEAEPALSEANNQVANAFECKLAALKEVKPPLSESAFKQLQLTTPSLLLSRVNFCQE